MTPAPNPLAYDYHLPAQLIAQQPAPQRDHSRLMVVDRACGRISHHRFDELPDLAPSGACFVFNDSRVIKARLLGAKERTGGKAEVFLYRARAEGPLVWEALTRVRGGLKQGAAVCFDQGVAARCIQPLGEGRVLVAFEGVDETGFDAFLARCGAVPLPPYIRRPADERDDQRYQCVYAGPRGAVAAPTAGLHFTPEMLHTLETRGFSKSFVTLHVSLGTFAPLDEAHLASGRLHPELMEVSPQTARDLNAARETHAPLLCVGTTAVRCLETAADPGGQVRPFRGETDIFIYPPYTFKACQCLLTNFHLPKSSLLMLVAAFAGRELVMEAYRCAVEEGYRFFSYGDAMLIR